MTNICSTCKYKSEAVTFDYDFKVIARYCRGLKNWIPADIDGCEFYESNLHDNNAAP